MAFFNPRTQNTIIGKESYDVKLTSDEEKDFHKYVYQKFRQKGCLNRSRKEGYTLAYGTWRKNIHSIWFSSKLGWDKGEYEWVLQNNKRPDFIFVKNKSNASAPTTYVIWEVKKAWLYCDSQRCQERGKHGDRCTRYRYCVDPSLGYEDNEVEIHEDDYDYENRYNDVSYYIVQSNSLDGLKSRAENQAKEYAKMLRKQIPNTNAMICYRSVVFVLYSRRNKYIKTVQFGDSKTL